jgi:hypothetical protein
LGGQGGDVAMLTILLMALASLNPEQCTAPTVLSVPLRSSKQVVGATTASGYKLSLVKDPPGWEVQVYSSADKELKENLLYPAGSWHGAFPCQVQPGTADLFGNTRRVAVRSSKASVCIRIREPRVSGESYVGGSLEVGWDETRQ